MSTQADPPDDPLVTKCVEAALAPYLGNLPDEEVEVFRAWLYSFYETNPEAVALLNEIREAQKPAPAVARSGEQLRRDPAILEEAGKRALRSVKGGKR